MLFNQHLIRTQFTFKSWILRLSRVIMYSSTLCDVWEYLNFAFSRSDSSCACHTCCMYTSTCNSVVNTNSIQFFSCCLDHEYAFCLTAFAGQSNCSCQHGNSLTPPTHEHEIIILKVMKTYSGFTTRVLVIYKWFYHLRFKSVNLHVHVCG